MAMVTENPSSHNKKVQGSSLEWPQIPNNAQNTSVSGLITLRRPLVAVMS